MAINKSAARFFPLLFACFLVFSCNSHKKSAVESPEGYDFAAGKKLFLTNKLEEISGIAFVPGNDTLLKAINDEDGRIFSVSLNSPKQKTEPFKFAGKGDYEDIAFFAGKWRVLESNGVIHSVLIEDSLVDTPVKLLPPAEYEGMTAFGDKLYVICKDCPESREGISPVYVIGKNGDSLSLEKTIGLDASGFVGKKKKNLLASALAKHPITNDWYVLSHLNGLLLITDAEFRVKQKIKLTRSAFLQPEGIAFTSNGDLFISNEGDESAGYIMVFPFRR